MIFRIAGRNAYRFTGYANCRMLERGLAKTNFLRKS